MLTSRLQLLAAMSGLGLAGMPADGAFGAMGAKASLLLPHVAPAIAAKPIAQNKRR
jgi:hypothetical protein